MLSWLLLNPRVKQTASTIHEFCSFAHQLHQTTGAPLQRFFALHPMLTNHRAPSTSDADQIHGFLLSDGAQGCQILVCDGTEQAKSWIMALPDGDFARAKIQTGAMDRYMVSLDQFSPHPEGKLARRLVAKFSADYDATNLT